MILGASAAALRTDAGRRAIDSVRVAEFGLDSRLEGDSTAVLEVRDH